MTLDKSRYIDWARQFEQLQQNSRNKHLGAYYQQGMVNADTPIEDVPLVALDFETTGLDSARDDIVSIGLVPFSTERIRCSQAEHWIVKPSRPLAEQSVVIHQITHSDILDAPDLIGILDDLLNALAGKVTVVHYRNIEREFLFQALMKRLGEGIRFPVIDTMALEQDRLRKNRGLVAKLLNQALPSLRLPDCRQRYGLPAYQLHHATIDAMATAELLQAQLAHHYTPEVPVGQLWC